MSAIYKGLLLSLLLAQAGTAVGTTRYVNGVTGSDLDSCLGPSAACKTIGHFCHKTAYPPIVRVPRGIWDDGRLTITNSTISGTWRRPLGTTHTE